MSPLVLILAIILSCAALRYSSRCNIEKVPLLEYLNGSSAFLIPATPIIFLAQNNMKLAEVIQLNYILEHHSEEEVILSSSNSYSHDQQKWTLGAYLSSLANISTSADATQDFYLFGNNYKPFWKYLEKLYVSPPCTYCDKAGAKTIGIGGRNSGVAFHMHGPGFSEVIQGKKHWFLYPPDTYPYHFSPTLSMHQWYQQHYEEEKRHPLLYECSIQPGEILYFPDKWVHATLNIGIYNFFVSLFLDIQLMR